MKQICKQMARAASLLCLLTACSNGDSNYPQEYIGFEKTTLTHSFDSDKDTEELLVKIVAADKKDEDRKVRLNGINLPEQEDVFSLVEKTVTIPAKKKSANLRVKIFPKRIKQKAIFRIVCTPQEKKAKKTEITVHLVRK